jgi:hypothetical protein
MAKQTIARAAANLWKRMRRGMLKMGRLAISWQGSRKGAKTQNRIL